MKDEKQDKYKYFAFPNSLGDTLFYSYLKEFGVFPKGIGLEKITEIAKAMCQDYLDGNISPEKLSEMAGNLVYSELADGISGDESTLRLIGEIADVNAALDGGPMVVEKDLTDQLVKKILESQPLGSQLK